MAIDDPKAIYPTKARYRVLETSYLNGNVIVVEPGEDAKHVFVDYDGHPGSNLEPADDEAKRRKAIYMRMRGGQTDEQIRANKLKLAGGAFYDGTPGTPAAPGTAWPASPAPVPVPIPDDWKKLQAVPLGLLAFKIAGEEPATAAEATKIIEAEVARRMGHAAAA